MRQRGRTSPATVTIRFVDNACTAAALLPPPVLNRLCSDDIPRRIRQRNVYLSQIVLALDDESAVGFAAFKTAAGPIRVAHELWVERHARAGMGEVTTAIAAALEEAVLDAGDSRLFVITVRSMPL